MLRGMKYIAGLANSVVTVINAGEYGKLIYDLFLRRELINIGEEMVNEAFDVASHWAQNVGSAVCMIVFVEPK